MIDYIIEDVARLVEEVGSRDPWALARHLKVHLREDPLGSLKGYLFFQSRIAVLCLNSQLPDTLRATVLCHELGHLRYHRNQKAMFSETRLFVELGQQEYEANLFAAEFLLEDRWVMKGLKEMDVYALAASLGIRPELLAFKLKLLQFKGWDLPQLPQLQSDFLKA